MYVVTEDWAKCGTTRRKIVANAGCGKWPGQAPPLPSTLKCAPTPLFLPWKSWIAGLRRHNFYVAACTQS